MPGIKGMKRTKSHNKKISKSLRGKIRSPSHCLNISKSAKKRLKNPINNSNWKGENVGYIGIHVWLLKNYKNPKQCELCGLIGHRKTGRWKISWALKKPHKYERKRKNFFGLCNKCHRSYDKTNQWNRNISLSKIDTQHGERNPNCKHKIKDIKIIRKLYKQGISMRELAKRFNYKGHTSICKIINNKQWMEIPK